MSVTVSVRACVFYKIWEDVEAKVGLLKINNLNDLRGVRLRIICTTNDNTNPNTNRIRHSRSTPHLILNNPHDASLVKFYKNITYRSSICANLLNCGSAQIYVMTGIDGGE